MPPFNVSVGFTFSKKMDSAIANCDSVVDKISKSRDTLCVAMRLIGKPQADHKRTA